MSLVQHNTVLPFRVHVMVPPGFHSRAKLDEAAGEHARDLIFYVLDDAFLKDLKQRDDLTVATYYRLLLGEVLPPELERVLYLDCDMMVRGDLAELWRMTLGSALVGAVPDPGFAANHILGLPPGASYFNAGLLLIDLVRWRAERVGAAALAFAADHPDRLTYNDQCALNWILRDNWLALDPKWNLQTGVLSRTINGWPKYFRPPPPVAETSRIVHFNSPGRPWLYVDDHPFKPDYLAYKARTAWREEGFADRYPHNMIIKFLLRHAPPLLPLYRSLRKVV